MYDDTKKIATVKQKIKIKYCVFIFCRRPTKWTYIKNSRHVCENVIKQNVKKKKMVMEYKQHKKRLRFGKIYTYNL